MVKLRVQILLSIVLLCLSSPSLSAQNQYSVSQLADESVDFLVQPARWDGNDWLRLGLVGLGTFVSMQADQPLRNEVMKDRSFYNNLTIEFGRFWGEPYPSALAVGAFGLHGLITDNATSKRIGFEVFQAAVYAGAVTTLLKAAFGRARPYTNEGASVYKPFTILDDGFHSLPSGHTTLAFALSTVLSKNVSSAFFKVLFYVPAALTAFSRVYQDYHWASDCMLGAAVGYAVASWVVDIHDRKESVVRIASLYPLTVSIAIN